MIAAIDDSSPTWRTRLIAELHASDERATTIAKPLSPDQLNWKRSPGEWSVGQCLEHLCIGNEVYVLAMAKSLEGGPRRVVQEIAPGWFGRWFIRSYIAPSSRTRRARAPTKIVPSSNVEPSILDRFLRSNHDTRELMHRARDYDVNRIRFRNPFIPLIYFTVGTGLEIVSKHEQRHLLQAERIRASPAFPA